MTYKIPMVEYSEFSPSISKTQCRTTLNTRTIKIKIIITVKQIHFSVLLFFIKAYKFKTSH